MKLRIALAAFAAAGALAAAQQVTAAATCDISYDAGATGAWTEAAKWNLDRVPAAGEAVCIPATSSVTLGTSVTPGDVDVAGHLTWTAGTMGVPAASALRTTTIQPGGRLTVAGSTAITGRDLVNGGLLELTGANGYLDGTGSPEPRVRNTGTIRRTTAGTATIYAQLENDGVVEATAGTLDLRGGGPSSDGGFGGAAGEVRFALGDYALADGAGWLGGVTQSGGTITIPAGTVAATGANAISGGTIAGAGGLSIGGSLTWTGGTMTGAGTTQVLAGTTVDVAGTPAISDGRTLANAGTILMSTANGYINATGATEPKLHNTGTIRRTAAGAGSVTLYPELENDGALEAATAGDLDLRGGGTGQSAGSFGKAGQAGTVRISLGDYALSDGASWLGGVTMSGGTVTVPDGATVTATGANTIAGGTITGTGTFLIAGPLTWTSGTMSDAGTTEVAAGTTVTHAGTLALNDGRSLVNRGTILMTTQNGYVNDTGTRPVSIVNVAGATIRRTATGTGNVTLYPPVDNDGTIRADDGVLELRGGGAGTSGGDFGPGGGTTVGRVRFASGTYALGAGARLLGQVEVQSSTLGVASGTVTVSGDGNKLISGAIAGAGAVEVDGTLAWMGGDMTGTGVTRVKPGATLVLGGTTSLEGGRTLENQGQIDVDGDRFLFDDFAAPAEKLVNTGAGTIAKTAGTGFGASLSVPLQNAGLVEAKVGKLRLGDGGPAPDTGTFEGASRADRLVFEGARTLGGSVQLLGTNEIAGDVGVAAGQTLTSGADLLQTGGELRGDLTITGTLTWDGGGQVAPGTTTVAPGGRIDLAGLDGACAFASLGEARRLDNQGTLKLTPGSDLSTYGEARPLISNPGRIELDGGSSSACGSTTGIYGDALVSNTGTIEKIAGSNGGFVGGTLDNDGEVVSSAGDLSLESNSAASQAGSFRSAGAGSTITFEEGVFDLAPTATLAGHTIVGGSGELSIPDGMTLTIPAGDELEQAGGTVGGPGRLRVAGTLTWNDGQQLGPGSTELQPGAAATVPADGFASLRDDRSLVNRGTLDLAGTLYVSQGATLLNASALNLAGAGRIDGFDQYGSGFAGLVHNTGTLTKSGAEPSEASAPLDNDGTIEVLGGTLELPSLLNWSGYGFFGTASGLTGGTFSVKAGSLIIPGPLTANGARLVLDGAGANVLYDPAGVQSPPTDALFALRRNAGNGELVLRGGRDLTIPDDKGAFVNQGVLDLGAGSVLEAKGFRQAAGGVLRPAVTAGGAGLVNSTGAADLAGRLDTPSPATVAGDTTILTATSIAGAFTVTGGYAAVPSATEIKLRIPPAAGGVPAPAAVAPATVLEPVEPAAATRRIAARALETDGPWARRGAYRVASERGATLRAPNVAGRAVSIVARTGPRAGTVRVTWAGRSRTVSLRSAKPRRRTIRVFVLRLARAGAMRITATSTRRVAVRALLVRR